MPYYLSTRHLALLFVTGLALTAIRTAKSAETWSGWVSAFVRLAGDSAMSNVSTAALPGWLASVADVKVDPKSACAEAFTSAKSSAEVASTQVFLLRPAGAGCDAYRFGMASFSLARRSTADLDFLRATLKSKFGEPSTIQNGSHLDFHWQLTPRRAIEFRYPENVGTPQPAGLTLVNVPAT